MSAKSIRAYIKLRLSTGEIINYVNSTVQDTQGKDSTYYSYSNEDGDKYIDQVGAGKALTDFESFVSQIGSVGSIEYPEGGTTLVRKNNKNSMAALSEVRRVIAKSALIEVIIEEQEVNEWTQQEIDRNKIV